MLSVFYCFPINVCRTNLDIVKTHLESLQIHKHTCHRYSRVYSRLKDLVHWLILCKIEYYTQWMQNIISLLSDRKSLFGFTPSKLRNQSKRICKYEQNFRTQVAIHCSGSVIDQVVLIVGVPIWMPNKQRWRGMGEYQVSVEWISAGIFLGKKTQNHGFVWQGKKIRFVNRLKQQIQRYTWLWCF